MGGCCSTSNSQDKSYIPTLTDAKDLKATYDIDKKVLGAGSFGKVLKGVNKKDKT